MLNQHDSVVIAVGHAVGEIFGQKEMKLEVGRGYTGYAHEDNEGNKSEDREDNMGGGDDEDS